MTTNLDDTVTNINFDDSAYSGTNISFPTKIVNVRKKIYNNTYNNTRDSSESDFSLVKRSASNSTTIRVHNKNTSYKKLGQKKDKVKDNNIERTVRKYHTRKITSTLPPKLQDPLTDTDSSIKPSAFSSYSTTYSSSSDWKINSESDISSLNKKKVVLVKL